MFTIVTSRTTISWASPTTPRISHRRESGVPAACFGSAWLVPWGMFIADIARLLSGGPISGYAGERSTNRRRWLDFDRVIFMTSIETGAGTRQDASGTGPGEAPSNGRRLRKDA